MGWFYGSLLQIPIVTEAVENGSMLKYFKEEKIANRNPPKEQKTLLLLNEQTKESSHALKQVNYSEAQALNTNNH